MIGAWAGQQPYSRRTGFISDLGAYRLAGFRRPGRLLAGCMWLMNASFVVQGHRNDGRRAAAEFGAAVHGSAAGRGVQAGCRPAASPGRPPFPRVPSPPPPVPAPSWSGFYLRTPAPCVARRGRDHVFRGRQPGPCCCWAWLWLRQTPGSWPILACGVVWFRSAPWSTGGRDGDGRSRTRHAGAAHGVSHHHRHGRRGLGGCPAAGLGPRAPESIPGPRRRAPPVRGLLIESAAPRGALMFETGPTFDYHEGIHRYIPVQRARRGSSACRMADRVVHRG